MGIYKSKYIRILNFTLVLLTAMLILSGTNLFGANFPEWPKVLPLELDKEESNLSFKNVKIAMDKDYFYVRFKYDKDLLLPGTILEKGSSTKSIDTLSVFFDVDNNPDTPKFLPRKGFEREIIIFQNAGVKYKNMEHWGYITYSFQVKDYEGGRRGEILFSSSAAGKTEDIIVDKRSITIRFPKKHLHIKEGTKVRIGFQFGFRKILTGKVIVR